MTNRNGSDNLEEQKVIYASISDSDRQAVINALRKGASRREVMGWLLAMGTTIGAASSIVTAASDAIAATPKKGGQVRFAADLHGPSDTLDPISFTSTIDYVRGRAIYNSLVQLNDDITSQPELAESFEANKDATAWTFKIRKGVEFHDGSKLTADDVIYSMNRHMGEDSTSNAKTLVASVTEWKKLDSHTVKAILDNPNADLPAILGTFHFKILKDGWTDFQKPVGTGPFALKEFKPGVRSVTTRNENYWREPAHLDQIEIFGITDKVARVNALLAEDIQMMMAIDPKAIGQVENSANAEIMSTPSGAYIGICCMKDKAPGSNDDFVLAMKYLQRRKRIVKTILKGHGTIGNDHPISPAYPDHCADVPQRPYDPDKAKFHLKKSGVTSAEVFSADVNIGINDTVLLMQREAAKIGFNLQVRKVPTDGYWGAIWLKKPINVVTWNMRPTAHSMLSIAFAPDAPWNDTAWKNERMGELLRLSAAETDAAKRKAMFCEMQTLISEECGMVIPVHVNFVDAKLKKLKGIGRSPLGACSASEWPEFAWLDA